MTGLANRVYRDSLDKFTTTKFYLLNSESFLHENFFFLFFAIKSLKTMILKFWQTIQGDHLRVALVIGT